MEPSPVGCEDLSLLYGSQRGLCDGGCVTWLLVLNMFGLVVGASFVLESFRRKPIWPRPEKSASPRQRRWMGFALLLMVSGSLVNWLITDVTNLALLAFGVMLLGPVLFIVGILKGPTDEELERRERMLSREGS